MRRKCERSVKTVRTWAGWRQLPDLVVSTSCRAPDCKWFPAGVEGRKTVYSRCMVSISSTLSGCSKLTVRSRDQTTGEVAHCVPHGTGTLARGAPERDGPGSSVAISRVLVTSAPGFEQRESSGMRSNTDFSDGDTRNTVVPVVPVADCQWGTRLRPHCELPSTVSGRERATAGNTYLVS